MTSCWLFLFLSPLPSSLMPTDLQAAYPSRLSRSGRGSFLGKVDRVQLHALSLKNRFNSRESRLSQILGDSINATPVMLFRSNNPCWNCGMYGQVETVKEREEDYVCMCVYMCVCVTQFVYFLCMSVKLDLGWPLPFPPNSERKEKISSRVRLSKSHLKSSIEYIHEFRLLL